MKICRSSVMLSFIFLSYCSSSVIAQGNLTEIFKKIAPSTVVILCYDNKDNVISQGSGFFISQNGDVITNRHVLENADHAKVKISEEKVYPITQIVAEDKEGDIIRVSIDIPSNFVYPLQVTSNIPETGEEVIVIGSPLGLERTISNGIVSAVRDIPSFGNIFQITASISPGSSGSPVVNIKGEVIGVASFQMLEGQNLNFAIPGERVIKLKSGKGKIFTKWKALRKIDESTFYNKGLNFFWAEDYDKALSYFEKTVKINPNHADAYFKIGCCNAKLKHYFESIEAFKQVICLKPDYAEAYYNLGIIYSDLELYTEAIETFKQAIRINPDFALAHYNLGINYANLGRKVEAIEAYKQAIRINPDDAGAHYNMGLSYGKLGRYSESIESHKEAIRINPEYVNAHVALGLAYSIIGRNSDAIEAYKLAIRIKPDDANAHYCLGLCYGELARYMEAIEAYKQAIRLKPDLAEAHFGLGFIYELIGNRGSALDEYKILKEIDKDLANELFNLIYK